MPRKKSTTLTDEQHIEQLINNARKLLPSKKIIYRADWLIHGEIGSDVWVVADNYVAGTTLTIPFDDFLPDGSRLNESKNFRLLATIQKVAFHLRMGSLPNYHGLYKQWRSFINNIVNLARWLILNAPIFEPQKHGFSLLTEDHIKGYLKEFAKGGVNSTLKIEERFLELLHSNIRSNFSLEEILDNRYHLDDEFIIQSAQWLKTQNAYINTKRPHVYAVSRTYLASVLGCTHQMFGAYPSVASLLNQFDLISSPLQSDKTELLKPDDRLATNENSAIVVRTMYTHRRALQIFASAHAKIPNEIPFLPESAFLESHHNHLAPDGHTPLIPMEIGLGAINSASELVIVYGKQMIEAVSLFAEQYSLLSTDGQTNERLNRLVAIHRSSWRADLEYGELPLFERYNVTSFSSQFRSNDIKKGITFKALHQTFYGACALLIGMCKPIREGELHKLQLDCLDSEFSDGGILLTQILEKSGDLGEHQIIQRPIPGLVATAIELLQVMSAKLRKIYRDENGPAAAKLFYLPYRYVNACTGKALGQTLNSAIDMFCLLLNPHLDHTGKPWKIRVQEMRKFFLLVMYKHHHGELRRTLGYGAGHITDDQIDEYTAFSHDDPESVKYESECISDRLIMLELGQVSPEGHDGLHALYTHVCSHFNVKKIQSLAHHNFIRFLNMLQRGGTCQSTVYTIEIKGPDGTLTTMAFAIKFEGLQDDQFDRG